MKIAFFSLMRIAEWGGSEELWSKTALLALAEGHEVESLTQGWNPESTRITKLRQAGVVTKFYYGDSQLLTDRIAVKLKLKKKRSEVIPPLEADVYVISNGTTWDFVHSYRVITDKIISTGKPFIIINHNSTGYGNILTGEQREYAIKVFQKASKILFVSELNKQDAERQLAFPIINHQVVGNPVSITNAFIKPFPESNTLAMAAVGSLECNIKGQDLLIEALSGKVWRNRDFRLRIYGKGPHEQYLRTLIKFYGLQDKVTLEGHTSDVDKIWETSQVLLLSSPSEGVPMVVVEAMLQGRTVLGTDVGAVDYYVEEGHTGFIVPSAKVKYMAAGLEKLWDNRGSLKQMGENAYHRATKITDMHPEQSFLAIIKSV